MKNEYKYLIKLFFISLFNFFLVLPMMAQKGLVSFRVFDSRTNEPIANVLVKKEGKVVSMGDVDGQFAMTVVGLEEKVQIEKEGYFPLDIDLVKQKGNIRMQYDPMSQNVTLLYESRRKKYMTGAVSSISGEAVKNIPGANRLNSLSGRLTGLLIDQTDGIPGEEGSERRIRGVHTFGTNQGPAVLIDGRVDNTTLLNPYDIESFTILKDAASAVFYGLNSTNGVILINTKKGKEGEITVGYNDEAVFLKPTRMPKILGAYDYARLYNEALLNDNKTAIPKYDDLTLTILKNKEGNKNEYPDVDFLGEFINDYAFQTRHNINVRGGAKNANFYVSGNYLYDHSMFKNDDKVNTYDTDQSINAMNVQGNVNLIIADRLSISTGIRAKKEKRNYPGVATNGSLVAAYIPSTILTELIATPPNAYALKTPGDSLGGTAQYMDNPYGLLNNSGYLTTEQSTLSIFTDFSLDLNDVLKGVKIVGGLGFNNTNNYFVEHIKDFAIYERNVDVAGKPFYIKKGTDTQTGSKGYYKNANNRNYEHYIGVNYVQQFGKHSVDALVMYKRTQFHDFTLAQLTNNHQGPKGRLSYRFNNRYLLDLSASYEGTEQYSKVGRYGLFPALSAGWILSEEKFIKSLNIFDFLKIRGSYGITGNESTGLNFSYMSSFGTGSNTVFGSTPTQYGGMKETRVENPALTWEKCTKKNVGIDFMMINNRLSATFDYFDEQNNDILINDAITQMYGASVTVPAGRFENHGLEIEVGWNDKVSEVNYFINANYSIAQNKLIYQNEVLQDYDWMYREGKQLNTRFGYIFDRFYTEDDFNDNGTLKTGLSDQSLTGSQKPGDLKFKDLNDDGVINNKDIAPIGSAYLPEVSFGINLGAEVKGFDLSVLFQGVTNATHYNQGAAYFEFVKGTSNQLGNVKEHHLERWQPGSGQSAGYPRLTLTNTNNISANSYWVHDASFVRLKSVELGYTVPKEISKKVGIQSARVYLNGNNLLCWDKIGYKDPEQSDDGLNYPIMRSASIGLNIQF